MGLLLFSCTKKEEDAPQATGPAVSPDVRVLATVNGDPITLGEFQERFNRSGIKPDKEAEAEVKQEFLNRIIERKMLLKEAQRRRIKVGLPEINERIAGMKAEQGKDVKEALDGMGIDYEKWKADIWENMMIDKLIHREIDRALHVSFQDVRKYYNSNPGEFEKPEQVRARQIVVTTEEEAQNISELLANKADFSELAKEKSTAPEASRGGDLGYFALGEMPAEFNVVFEMKKGAVSGVIKSPYGYHIFKLEDRRPAGRRTLDEATDAVRQKLLQEKRDKRYQQWLRDLRSRTRFEINYEALK